MLYHYWTVDVVHDLFRVVGGYHFLMMCLPFFMTTVHSMRARNAFNMALFLHGLYYTALYAFFSMTDRWTKKTYGMVGYYFVVTVVFGFLWYRGEPPFEVTVRKKLD